MLLIKIIQSKNLYLGVAYNMQSYAVYNFALLPLLCKMSVCLNCGFTFRSTTIVMSRRSNNLTTLSSSRRMSVTIVSVIRLSKCLLHTGNSCFARQNKKKCPKNLQVHASYCSDPDYSTFCLFHVFLLFATADAEVYRCRGVSPPTFTSKCITS